MLTYTTPTQVSPVLLEAQLLLACARIQLTHNHQETLRDLVGKNLDWDTVLRTAPQHGMIPLLYHHISLTCPSIVPPEILERLQNHYQGNAQRNLFLTGELIKTLDLLKEHGIAAIPFKGPTLAVSLYGDWSLRQFCDLDLLIHVSDVVRAKELLLSHGHTMSLSGMNKAEESLYIQHQAEYNFSRYTGGSRVNTELHWGFVPGDFSPAFNPGSCWERLQPVTLQNRTFLTFAPEDLLLILCIQRTKHLWDRVDWICDIAEILRQYSSLDWNQVFAQAQRWRCQRLLLLGLQLAQMLLGVELPPSVAQKIEAEPRVKAIALQVTQSLFNAPVRMPRAYQRVFFQLQTRECWQDRLHYCLKLATTPTPTEWEQFSLPESLAVLYPLLRPVRLLKQHGLRPLKYWVRKNTVPQG